MVAQDGHGLWAGGSNHAQDLGRLGTAIDKVPHKPELVLVASKGELTDQGR